MKRWLSQYVARPAWPLAALGLWAAVEVGLAGSRLPNGIAAGDVTTNSAVIWTRAAAATFVTFEYSTDATFATGVSSTTVPVTSATLPVKATLTELSPGTTYYYRASDGTATRSGRFTTATPPVAYRGLSFGVSGDWRGELSPYPAIANADNRELDLFVLLGDTVYADVSSPAVPLPQATTPEEFRAKHAEVYGERFGLNTWADLRAVTPVLATIDDHEVTNDFAGGAPPASDPRFAGFPGAFINETELYENGLDAFEAYNPIAAERYSGTGDARFDGKYKLYRERSYGRDATFIVTDARSFRDQGLPPVTNPTDPVQIGQFLAASFNPTRTMLGRPQVEDLKAALCRAQANGVTWKFVLVPEPIQNLGVVAASDRFEGYAAERTEILGYIHDNGIDNVVFIAADIHGTLVNNLTYQVGPGQPQIRTTAWEITTGSVAYDAPFGPTVVTIAALAGLITPTQLAFYQSLPRAGRDQFVEQLVNAQVTPLGYDPLGLGGSEIPATLEAGAYSVVHTYGWTEFTIDAKTQALTVTTWGIDPYTEAELLADPNPIIARTPTVLQRFTVLATLVPRDTRADLNCDGAVNFDDINGFVLAVLGETAYEAVYPDCDILNGDLNDDAIVNFDDITGFIECLVAGGCTPCP